MDLKDFYRVFHPATGTIHIAPRSHGTFSKIDHILVHKATFNQYKKIEITPCIMYDDIAIILKPNKKRSSRKYSNNTMLNDQ
jgi:hypothetical protein